MGDNEVDKSDKGVEHAKIPEKEQPVVDARGQIEALTNPKKLALTASYEELEDALPVVAAMKGFDQRSDYHSLTLDEHTRELVRGLESNPFIANHPKRDIILLAGRLHDIGKTSPDGHQIHPKDPKKRKYVGHEEESARMVRELLPQHFELSGEDQEFVVQLALLHASALGLINSFESSKGEPKGKKLRAFDEFMKKADAIPGDIDLEGKMRIIFDLNRADKMAGFNGQSDRNDSKVQSIIKKSDGQVAILDEMEKALPALVKAVTARRAGDKDAGIVKVEGKYYYTEDAPNKEVSKKIEVPTAIRPLGGILRNKMMAVAEIYPTLEARKDNLNALKGMTNGLLKGKLKLTDEQVDAVLATLK